jgi:hypothetical protein
MLNSPASPITVMHEVTGVGVTMVIDRLFERTEHQVRAHGRGHAPAHDPSREDIDDKAT